MPVVTVVNKAARTLPVNSYFGTLAAGRSKSVELTTYQMEQSRDQLVALAAAGLIAWSVAANTSTADDAVEAVTQGQLQDGSVTATFASPLTVGTIPVMVGAGDPEGAVTAAVGSVFLRTDGGASTTLYVKESGTGNTGWAAK